MQAVRTRSLLEGALLAALVALLGLVSWATGLTWLAAVPIMLAYGRNGGRNALMVTAVGSFLLLLWGGPFAGLSTFGFGLALGVVPGWAVRRGSGAAGAVLLMAGAFVVVTVIGAVGYVLIWHQNVWAQTWTSMKAFIVSHGALLSALHLSAQQATALLRDLLPLVVGGAALGQAVAVYVIADAVLRRLHSPLPAVPEFARWRAPRWLLAIYLGALAVYFIARAPAEQVVRAVALNLLLGLGVLYGIVGLAAAYGWLRYRGTPRSRSVALLILGAAVLEAVGMAALVSIFGMLASQVDLASVFADPAGHGREEP